MATVTLLSSRMEADALGRWATWMRAQSWSEETVRERLNLVKRVSVSASVSATQLTADDVREFLAGGTFGDSTRRAYYLWLQSWFRWCVLDEIRDDNPTDRIPKPKAGRRQIRPLRTAHVEAMLATNMRARTRTMILLGAYQGFRVSEIAKVSGRDVDRLSETIRVEGKGGVVAYLPLHPIIAAESAAYDALGWWFPSRHNPTGHVRGESVTDVVGDVMRRAGVPGTPHGLRHWYATELLRQGVDIRVIQQLMRHASLATTEQYLHVEQERERAGILTLPDLRAA